MPRHPLTEKEFLELDAASIASICESAENDLLFVTVFVSATMLIHAYTIGIFTMPLPDFDQIPVVYGWYFPKVRGVIPIPPMEGSCFDDPPRSLKKSRQSMHLTTNQDYRRVVAECKDAPRNGKWIDDGIEKLYLELGDMEVGYSIEVWDAADHNELIGGLYGVRFGHFFAGESMFHKRSDASKVALWHLVEVAPDLGIRMIDTQWPTAHLRRMGTESIPWQTYLEIITS